MARPVERNPEGSTEHHSDASDPSVLTTAQLRREVENLRLFYDARFESKDKAIALLQAQADKVPSIAVIEERVISLSQVIEERFKGVELQFSGIELQFKERDVRQEQISTKDQTALKDALTAAKEIVNVQNTSSSTAIAKSEAATSNQITQIVATFSETTKGLAEKMDATTKAVTDKIDTLVDGLKDRLSIIERGGAGIVGRGEGRHETWGAISATIIAVGAAIAAVIAVIALVMKA